MTDLVAFDVLGVPYDGGTVTNPGARHGPELLRTLGPALTGDRAFDPVEGVFVAFDLVDRGDILPLFLKPSSSRTAIYHAIETRVSAVLQARRTPILIGGDHSITGPAVLAAARARPGLELVVFDAHLDADGLAPATAADTTHANFLDLTSSVVKRTTIVGIRDPLPEHVAGLPYTLVAPDQVATHAWEFSGPVYLSIDVDVMDPALFPATGHPLPGGLSAREVAAAIRAIARNAHVVGADLVETMPHPGWDQMSATTLAWLVRTICTAILSSEAQRHAR